MPTYHARGIHVSLHTASLSDSTTPELKYLKHEASKNCEAAAKKLRENVRLSEEIVPFPGEDREWSVNWLGCVPFLQVLAGKKEAEGGALYGASSQTRGPGGRFGPSQPRAAVTKPAVPKALVLHVVPSDSTFVPLGELQDLRIDVYFNGMFTNTLLLHPRDITPRGEKPNPQIFSGTRIHLQVERPWILNPPGPKTTNRKPVGVKERWRQLGAALMKEADDCGFSNTGRRPPSAEYLVNLARMPMPERVKSMQKPDGQSFGVVDVVITAGKGNKAPTYIHQPEKMPDTRFNQKHRSRPDQEVLLSDTDAPGETDSEFEREFSEVSFRPSPPQSVDEYSRDDNDVMEYDHISMPAFGQGSTRFHSQNQLRPTVNPMDLDLYATPSIMSSQPRPVSMGEASVSSFNPLSNWTPNLGLSGSGMFTSPTDTSSVPHFDGIPGYMHFGGHAFAPPPQLAFPYLGPVRHVGPLPPIGRFSVPKTTMPVRPEDIIPEPPAPTLPPIGNFAVPQPMRALDPGIIDPDQPRSSFLLSRLVISDVYGNTIVDHRWSVPQRIPINNKTNPRNYSPEKCERKRRASPGADGFNPKTKVAAISRVSLGRGRARLSTPPPTPQTMDLCTTGGVSHTTRETAGDPSFAPMMMGPTGARDQVPGLLKSNHNGPSTQAPTMFGPTPPSSAPLQNFLANNNGPVPEKRMAPANSFELDDPEVLLRRPARTSRPTAGGLSMQPKRVQPQLLFDSDSSPLSSAPSSPSLEAARESSLVSPSKASITSNPSPLKVSAPAQARPQRPKVKPKARERSPTPKGTWSRRKYRNNARPDKENLLNPMPNPKLNRDCIIAFAEGGEDGKAILRQAKGQKAGDFTEDMVVVGMRFFVTG